MISAVLAALLVLAAATATAVVVVADVARQAAAMGVYGLVLALLFVVLQAPDVALSELVVGGIGLPVMILLAVARADADRDRSGR